MQLEDMKDERVYRQGLKDAMATPATTTSIAPDAITPQEGVQTLAGMMPNALPGQPQDFAMQPEPVSPTVEAYNEGRVSSKTESPTQAGMKYAMSQGKYEDVSKLMTVDDLMNKYAAHILQTGGDPVAYQKAMAQRAEGKELVDVISKFKGNPKLLAAAWPALQKAYPSAAALSPDDFQLNDDGTVLGPVLMDGKKVEGKGVFRDSNGVDHVVDAIPKAENEEQLTARAVKGDKEAQAILDAMQRRKVAIAKESRPVVKVATGGSGATTGRGKLKPGYRWSADGETAEPIPGTPEAAKAADRERKAKLLIDGVRTKTTLVNNTIDKAINQISGASAGAGAYLKAIPYTAAKALDGYLDTIKANVGFKTLQEMREASPTGGALGQVSDREIGFLQAALASLDQKLDPEQLKESLNVIKTSYQNWLNVMEEAYPKGGNNNPPVNNSPPVPKSGVIRYDAKGNRVQ